MWLLTRKEKKISIKKSATCCKGDREEQEDAGHMHNNWNL